MITLIVGIMDDKKALLDLGGKIKKFRQLKGLTQYALADKYKINHNYIGMLERGERNPTYFTLLAVANGLEIELSDLLKG